MSPAPLGVRSASARDAAAIADIYNQGIEDRLATLETEPRSADERARWLAARSERHPVIVAELGDTVVGWGSLNAFNPRPAYDPVADFSVYVERERRGQGIGRALLEALLERAPVLGYHKLALAALPENAAGIALYEHLGFQRVGTYHEHGQLDGSWVDVLLMERLL